MAVIAAFNGTASLAACSEMGYFQNDNHHVQVPGHILFLLVDAMHSHCYMQQFVIRSGVIVNIGLIQVLAQILLIFHILLLY